jgi:Spy/CpxP family protein refolding chaperone
MKKALLITAIAAVLAAVPQSIYAAPAQSDIPSGMNKQAHIQKNKEQMKKQFEERLKLTDKQKEKAKKLHEKGRAEMEPVMTQMKAKYSELRALEQSNLSEDEKDKKIDQLKTEIKALDKQAKELRKKNSEDFEKILNKNQKAELDKMKAEGRARFEREHKARPPFQGLGSPNLFTKPMLAPQIGR